MADESNLSEHLAPGDQKDAKLGKMRVSQALRDGESLSNQAAKDVETAARTVKQEAKIAAQKALLKLKAVELEVWTNQLLCTKKVLREADKDVAYVYYLLKIASITLTSIQLTFNAIIMAGKKLFAGFEGRNAAAKDVENHGILAFFAAGNTVIKGIELSFKLEHQKELAEKVLKTIRTQKHQCAALIVEVRHQKEFTPVVPDLTLQEKDMFTEKTKDDNGLDIIVTKPVTANMKQRWKEMDDKLNHDILMEISAKDGAETNNEENLTPHQKLRDRVGDFLKNFMKDLEMIADWIDKPVHEMRSDGTPVLDPIETAMQKAGQFESEAKGVLPKVFHTCVVS